MMQKTDPGLAAGRVDNPFSRELRGRHRAAAHAHYVAGRPGRRICRD
ncbi:hypothetical protein [Komagataeibacter sp. FNDCF1]|nr:hypothetical protein [Komagataeibacter sp. FNDCF1]MCE2563210.1 hypothetical protein [Komagataeibacter sp. FNDCF1]